MPPHEDAIESLASSTLRLEPPARVREAAQVADYDSWYASWERNPEKFWDEAARALHWFEPWQRISEVEIPAHRWFVGGKTNLSYNCLERNIERGLGDKVALNYESEHDPSRSYTYSEILDEVCRAANALRSLGVEKGDRVVVYMPLGPVGIFVMQACARIGAIHSVVYAGIGAGALRQRIEDSSAKIVVCADVTYRRGKTIALKGIVDEAVRGLDHVEHVVVHRREASTVLASERELDFEELTSRQVVTCDAVSLDSGDVAFILYTSGTTGKPKGVVHVHGGFAVGVHLLMRNYFDTSQSDVWWSTSDIGWIVGHAYICYGPFLVGCSQVIREGTPDYPDSGVIWRMVEKHRVTTMFTAPTTVRMFMKMGEESVEAYDRSSLRMFYCAGEPFNPEAWTWAQSHIVDQGFVADNYWQTEIASPMLGTFPTMDAKPGFVGKPMPGIRLRVVDHDGEVMEPGEGGTLIMEQPVPWMMQTVWGDPERYDSYWNKKLGGYVTGDIAVCDRENYWAVLGRSDDVLNVSGHRIGTADVESSLISHDAVVEAAVIGIPDEIKGEAIKAFVVLHGGESATDGLAEELKLHVRYVLGPIAQPSAITIVETLPKTRSGKIMRRLLKARELGLDEGDTSTLED